MANEDQFKTPTCVQGHHPHQQLAVGSALSCCSHGSALHSLLTMIFLCWSTECAIALQCAIAIAHYLPQEKASKMPNNWNIPKQYLKEYKVFSTLEMYMENLKERSQTFLSLYKSSVATTISTSDWQLSKIIYCILLGLEEGL